MVILLDRKERNRKRQARQRSFFRLLLLADFHLNRETTWQGLRSAYIYKNVLVERLGPEYWLEVSMIDKNRSGLAMVVTCGTFS